MRPAHFIGFTLIGTLMACASCHGSETSATSSTSGSASAGSPPGCGGTSTTGGAGGMSGSSTATAGGTVDATSGVSGGAGTLGAGGGAGSPMDASADVLCPDPLAGCRDCAKSAFQCGCDDNCLYCLFVDHSGQRCSGSADYWSNKCMCLFSLCRNACPADCMSGP